MAQTLPDFIIIKRLSIEQVKKDTQLLKRLITLSNGFHGSMESWIVEAICRNDLLNIVYVAIDKRNKKIVGWSIVSESMTDTWGIPGKKIGTYVDSQYRRIGIGTRLVKAIRRVTKTFAYYNGTDATEAFYSSIISSKKGKYLNRSWGIIK